MSKKKKILIGLLCFMMVVLNIIILTHRSPIKGNITLSMAVKGSKEGVVQLFPSMTGEFSASVNQEYKEVNTQQTLSFDIDVNTKYLRYDFGDDKGDWEVTDITYSYKDEVLPLQFVLSEKNALNSISDFEISDVGIKFQAVDEDPYIITQSDFSAFETQIAKSVLIKDYVINILAALFFDIVFLMFLRRKEEYLTLPAEIWGSRKLILNLAKNDFKTRYAGSYLGIVWAFIQPVVTIMVYVMVFTVGFKSGTTQNIPFTLYLIGGMVPWLYFQEALGAGTGALLEYSYLVKKVVFKISILPIVKLISAMFVHICFVAFAVFVFIVYGYIPDIHIIQIIYYAFAMFVFVLAICYTTSAIVVFFRDLTQIIMIILQVGVWSMPILWDIGIAPAKWQWIFKINPMYYIVSGYRQSLYEGVWVWDRFAINIYFWVITIILLAIGTTVFKRLKVHFADVL
ncbi:ABC transporter permease [Frisingicoccus sp.]|uniref:ABC transporter permease n=1 Tax=Frisingicoccus sp. TaxID=1918627 RepID=UPI003AB3A6D2